MQVMFHIFAHNINKITLYNLLIFLHFLHFFKSEHIYSLKTKKFCHETLNGAG